MKPLVRLDQEASASVVSDLPQLIGAGGLALIIYDQSPAMWLGIGFCVGVALGAIFAGGTFRHARCAVIQESDEVTSVPDDADIESVEDSYKRHLRKVPLALALGSLMGWVFGFGGLGFLIGTTIVGFANGKLALKWQQQQGLGIYYEPRLWPRKPLYFVKRGEAIHMDG